MPARRVPFIPVFREDRPPWKEKLINFPKVGPSGIRMLLNLAHHFFSLLYYKHMKIWKSAFTQRMVMPPKILNKTFYQFLFSFVAVIAGVLLLILVLGVGSGVQ